jgi:hypothetical protein
MAVNPVTKLVQPHGVVLFPRADSDHEGIDRAMDDFATGDDIYSTTYEPTFGLEHVAVLAHNAATEASSPPTAGPNPAAAAEPSSARRPAGTPEDL